jgi:hypothetical protein
MKEAWSEENDQIEVSHEPVLKPPKHHKPSLLTGLAPLPDERAVHASLPSRDKTDRLIARFFEDYTPAMPGKCEFSMHPMLNNG